MPYRMRQGLELLGASLMLIWQLSPASALVIDTRSGARYNSITSLITTPTVSISNVTFYSHNPTVAEVAVETAALQIRAPVASSFLLPNNKCWSLSGLHARCDQMGAFDDVPPPAFDPFQDLNEVDMSPFHDAEVEKRFFDFTEANLETSDVKVWYARWTENQKNNPRFQEVGEWPFFIEYFTGNSNFQCHLGSECQDIPTPEQLARRFPRNPQLVRRIHFVSRFYKNWHNMNSQMVSAYSESNNWMIRQLYNIVHSFSEEPSPSDTALCKMYHSMSNLQMVLPMMIVSSIVYPGYTTAYIIEGQRVSELLSKPASPAIIEVVDNSANLAQPSLNFNVNEWLQRSDLQTPLGQRSEWSKYIEGIPDADLTEGLDQGKSADTLCSGFEGAYQIDLAGNIEKLGQKLSTNFGKLHEDLRKIYRGLYWGKNIADGEISPAAAIFATQKWRGDESIWNNVENAEPWIGEFKLRMFMQFASAVSSSNYQYMKCTTSSKAASRCAKATGDTQTCRKNDSDNCEQAVFCPHPETNPHLICAAHRWHLDDNYSGEKDVPWLQKFASVFKDESNPIFKNITLQDMLRSFWDFYETTSLTNGDFASSSNSAGGFHLPVCYSEGMNIDDRKFPSGCGRDYRAAETKDFMNRLHVGVGSDAWARRYMTVGNELFVDRIPQTLSAKFPQAVSPITNFLTLCNLNLRLTRCDKDKWLAETPGQMQSLHQEADPSCQLVTDATATLSQHEANQWFCVDGAGEHGVFDKEKDTAFMRSHKARCEDWKKGSNPRGVDFDMEDLKIWIENANP